MKEISIKNLKRENSINNHPIEVSLYDKRNMGYSKDMPYKIGFYDHNITSMKSGIRNG